LVRGFFHWSSPAEAGEVACDGDRDERAALAALGVEAPPDLVESLLGFPGDRDRELGLTVLAALERCALARRAAVVPAASTTGRAWSRSW
jgi:hypothetical protein